ncbi:hypothetical protein RFI_39861 [Reticulomyxa filosa]|uniref:Uncharacterized protein n=1 Tax=Reticulomyxa filosa TaxID=46433 RepID=X6L8C2_RETFI|nr:hypothetical protein RFI_39861 [Reticulomyxa filosa]|eukprot:ETN97668.1 hypothetical protein RFI_39861 [Reticulomyxa filosa]
MKQALEVTFFYKDIFTFLFQGFDTHKFQKLYLKIEIHSAKNQVIYQSLFGLKPTYFDSSHQTNTTHIYCGHNLIERAKKEKLMKQLSPKQHSHKMKDYKFFGAVVDNECWLGEGKTNKQIKKNKQKKTTKICEEKGEKKNGKKIFLHSLMDTKGFRN